MLHLRADVQRNGHTNLMLSERMQVEMRRTQTCITACLVLFAFGALTSESAWAVEWLSKEAAIANPQAADTEGTVELHHAGGLAGALKIRCAAVLAGIVGPGAADAIQKLFDLAGKEVTQAKRMNCEVVEGKLVGCKPGEMALMAPVSLPWETQLLLNAKNEALDVIRAAPGKAEPTVEVVCNGFKILCEGSELAEFELNNHVGAVFGFNHLSKSKCGDGGEGWLTGEVEVPNFEVS